MTRLGSTLNAMFPAFYLISPSSVVSLSLAPNSCSLPSSAPFSVLRATCLFVFCFRSLPLLDSKYNFFCICRAPVRGCQLLSLLVACDNIFARIKALAARACACAPACELSVTVPAPLPVNRILDADNNEIMSAKETYFLWRFCF